MLAEEPKSDMDRGSGVAAARRAHLQGAWISVRASSVPFSFAEAVIIRNLLDPSVRISFMRHHGPAAESFSDVAVVVRLPNGKDLAAYRLTGSLPADTRNQIQNILSVAESREITALQAARALWNATSSTQRVAWVPERILDRARGETVVPPMGYVIPSFGEYLANTEAASASFFCARMEGTSHVRLESHMSVDTGRVVLDLSITDEHGKITKQLFELTTSRDRYTCSAEDIRRDLLIQTYNAMEVLWHNGSEELQRYLLVTESDDAYSDGDAHTSASNAEEEALVDSLIANGSLDLPAWDASYELHSGAHMHFGAGTHLALVTLFSDASDYPAVHSWIFRDVGGDLSDPDNQKRQAILKAVGQFAMYESDEVRLDAIERLRALADTTPMSIAPPLDSIIGVDSAESLRSQTSIKVATVVPASAEDVVRMSHGIHSIRLSFSKRELIKNSPHLLDQIYVSYKPDGDVDVTAMNQLGGRITAVISRQALPDSYQKGSFLLDLADSMADQRSRGVRSIQRFLDALVEADNTASWVSVSGDPYACAIPSLQDTEGHKMYHLGSRFIKKYAEISRGSPDECRLDAIGEGKVVVTLEASGEPYQCALLIDHGRVTRIEITPTLREDEITYRPNYDESRLYQCSLSVITKKRHRSILVRTFHLFDSLLSSLSTSGSGAVAVDFDRSELRNFLDRHFGPPWRHNP